MKRINKLVSSILLSGVVLSGGLAISTLDNVTVKAQTVPSNEFSIDVNNYELCSCVAQTVTTSEGCHLNGYVCKNFNQKYWIDVIEKNKGKLKSFTDDYQTYSPDLQFYCDRDHDGNPDKDAKAGGINVYGKTIKTVENTKAFEDGRDSELITNGLPVYYYYGKSPIEIDELSGALIAPYTDVTIHGQNSGCVIAKAVTYTGGEAHRNISGIKLISPQKEEPKKEAPEKEKTEKPVKEENDKPIVEQHNEKEPVKKTSEEKNTSPVVKQCKENEEVKKDSKIKQMFDEPKRVERITENKESIPKTGEALDNVTLGASCLALVVSGIGVMKFIKNKDRQ